MTVTGDGLVALTSADGNRFSAFLARAEEPGGPGVVILPDVRGLHPGYEELATRFADAGVDALAIDWFGRTLGPGRHPDDLDYMAHVARTNYAGQRADLAAAVAALTGGDRPVGRVFTIGFSFGGRLSFLAAVEELPLAGVIGLYGWPVGESRNDMPAPIDLVDRFSVPVLGLFGAADAGVGPDAPHRFGEALLAAGVEHDIVVYPDTPHSFFDRTPDVHPDAAGDAWRRITAFVDDHREAG